MRRSLASPLDVSPLFHSAALGLRKDPTAARTTTENKTSHCLFEKRPIVDFHRGNEREEHGFHTIEAQIVYPLQTLFPSCKIAIFCHIVPLENSLYR